jgi:hypothetical protein
MDETPRRGDDRDRVELPAGKARQGTRSPRVLLILLVSLAAAIIVWWLVDLYFQAALEPRDPMEGASVPSPSDPVQPDGTR